MHLLLSIKRTKLAVAYLKKSKLSRVPIWIKLSDSIFDNDEMHPNNVIEFWQIAED